MGLQNLIVALIFAALFGVLLGLWLIMATDLTWRELNTWARLAWWALLIFVPGLGLLVYYFTVVNSNIGVPVHLDTHAGGLLVTNRSQVILLLAAIALLVLIALMVTPGSFEVVPSQPVRVP